MTRFKRASGMASTNGGKTWIACSPLVNTTKLCRMSSLLWMLTPLSMRTFSSASAALPLYRRKWLHAFKLTPMALSGCACKYTARISSDTS